MIYPVFFLSGVAGLGYEIVWTRLFAVGLGHEFPGLLAVVAAYFGGFAIGAWALDRVVSRSRVPGHWYVALECAIGLWALATIRLIPWANERVGGLTGLTPSPVRQWAVAFAVPFLVLLPATIAMGATLPAMDRLFSRLRRDGRSVGGLYAANTFGAVAGTLISTFVLIPAAGYRATLVVLAGVNLVCAVLVLLGPARSEARRLEVQATVERRPADARLWTTVFVTGLLGIGYEVLGVRVMAQVLENTVFSFASALSVYLLGTAAGAAGYQAFGRRAAATPFLTALLGALSLACGFGVVMLWNARELYEGCRTAFGGGPAGSVAAEMVLAVAVFLLPTLLMGATFSHLAQAARRTGGGVGAALALNTFAGALAPLLFGVLLLPAVGSRIALICVAAGYLAAAPQFRLRWIVPAVALLAGLIVHSDTLLLIETGPGDRIVASREGVMAAVAVIDTSDGRRILKVNDKFQMGGTGPATFVERRRAHIPLLLHPRPRTALFLGTGTGVTFSTAAVYPQLHADGVELLPEAVDLMPLFRSENAAALDNPRLSVFVADARRFIHTADRRYDVIVADLFQPARDGSGTLYTVEHFRAVRQRLDDGGLFCQWIPLYQLDGRVLKVVIRSFLRVFPQAMAFMAHFNVDNPMLALVGTLDRVSYQSEWYERRVQDAALAAALVRVALRNGLQLFGCYIGSSDGLARFAGDGPLNTDDRPVVAFAAPRFVYTRSDPPYANLEALLEAFEPAALPEVIADSPGDRHFAARLSGYLRARNLYLRGLIALTGGDEEKAIRAWLDAVRASADFRTAYESLLLLARQRAPAAPHTARRILTDLALANPARSEARRMLRQLPPPSAPRSPQ
ncbi:MAG: fused MFS/spermidine synthase [Phycisphaerae bacterium]